jgi:hypothetical protein
MVVTNVSKKNMPPTSVIFMDISTLKMDEGNSLRNLVTIYGTELTLKNKGRRIKKVL